MEISGRKCASKSPKCPVPAPNSTAFPFFGSRLGWVFWRWRGRGFVFFWRTNMLGRPAGVCPMLVTKNNINNNEEPWFFFFKYNFLGFVIFFMGRQQHRSFLVSPPNQNNRLVPDLPHLHPFETYATVKMASSSPNVRGEHHKNLCNYTTQFCCKILCCLFFSIQKNGSPLRYIVSFWIFCSRKPAGFWWWETFPGDRWIADFCVRVFYSSSCSHRIHGTDIFTYNEWLVFVCEM